MSIQVIGQSFDVGESLTTHVKTTIEKKIEKFNKEAVSANIVFTSAPHKKVLCSINMQLKGIDFFTKKEGDDAYISFNKALTEIENQLIKNKEKSIK